MSFIGYGGEFHVLHMSHDTKQLGELGENLAAEHLIQNGYKIIQRNYRNKIGEIDIVAKKKGTLVFVEVKTRESTYSNDFLPEQNVNFHKQSKLKKLCEMYLTQYKHKEDQEWQIDVIGIILDKSHQKATINHIQNAVYG